MVSQRTQSIELFDRVKIREDTELVELRGKEGTISFVGATGINVVIENIETPVPLLWSEFEKVDWESKGG